MGLTAQSGADVTVIGGVLHSASQAALHVTGASLEARDVVATGVIGLEALDGTLWAEGCEATGVEAGVKAWGTSTLDVHGSLVRGVEFGLTSQSPANVTTSDIRSSSQLANFLSAGVYSTGPITLDRCVIEGQGGSESTLGAYLGDVAVVANSVVLAGPAPIISTGVEVAAGGTLTLGHCYVRSDEAWLQSTAVSIDAGGTATLVNDVLAHGVTASYSRAVYVGESASAEPRALLFPQSSCTIAFGGFPPYPSICLDLTTAGDCGNWSYGCLGVEGLLAGDPLFVDPLADWTLGAGSPALDSGVDPSAFLSAPLRTHDLYGSIRPLGASWDRGPSEQ
jgi:hypothetical protein